ncbi:uncharacterized protein DDB_G0290587-like [Macrobrachium rosenbergii]|uniref:uncharacterized protein DDB_G0290587-like n=1 Tax=Macrobrachium rosenbergii TaxID=79674 RepID=UPI0034D75C5D
MDSYPNTHQPDVTKRPLTSAAGGGQISASVFFPSVPPDGQSSTSQTTISHPINIPCPAFPVPGILTPPDTPTSPFGFAMKQLLPPRTNTNQETSFCVSTTYGSSTRPHEKNQNKPAAFVRVGNPLVSIKNNPSSLRPRLRLNTNLEIHRSEQPDQEGPESRDKSEPGPCDDAESESYDEIEPDLCDELEPEPCAEMNAEKKRENKSSDVEMTTCGERELPGEKDRDKDHRVLCFIIGSDLRKIADQFQATYARVRFFNPVLIFEVVTSDNF